MDLSQAPIVTIWEVTQACDLVCLHCRASARPWRDPGELTTEEGLRLIDEAAEMGTRLFVFSGGDPLAGHEVRSPQTNGFVERFHRTVLDEFFRPPFRRTFYEGVDQLQGDLDRWLYHCERPHRGSLTVHEWL